MKVKRSETGKTLDKVVWQMIIQVTLSKSYILRVELYYEGKCFLKENLLILLFDL